MTTLILSPVVALTLVSATQTHVASTPPVSNARAVAHIQGRVAPLVVAELREPQTEAPSPVATPAPVSAPPAVTLAPSFVPAPTAVPKPAPTTPPVTAGPPADPNSVIGIIEAAAARWGVSGSWMVKIARCESGLRTNAVNPSGPYIGLFQFLQSTFRGNGGTNIYDAADQSEIAAKMLAHGQAHQWSCA